MKTRDNKQMNNETVVTPCGNRKCYCFDKNADGHCAATLKPRLTHCPDYKPDATERMYEILDCLKREK